MEHNFMISNITVPFNEGIPLLRKIIAAVKVFFSDVCGLKHQNLIGPEGKILKFDLSKG